MEKLGSIEQVEVDERKLRKGTINTNRIKSLKDVRMIFELFNISVNEKHPSFTELEEKGFLDIIEPETVVEIKKNEE